ncbi:Abi family protein [Spirulina major]|uniref:Abi family protein n=1 Tax=Spirulina major TaxID=270636 RepID=UPI000933981C|nr:Abi family protein [Spirulina major]
MSQRFTKSPKTVAEQISLLQKRGLIIPDHNDAEQSLSRINYYRLKAYFLPFERDHTHIFKENTSFSDILALYTFDRKLRLHLLDALEHIEISIRRHFAYELSMDSGAHAHLQSGLFDRYWQSNIEYLKQRVQESTEDFIEHFKNNYSEDLPPLWVVVEVMYFRTVSYWLSSLKKDIVKRRIAKHYQISPQVLVSWVHYLSVIRNTCAHHSRLWNREILIQPKQVKQKSHILNGVLTTQGRTYNALVIMLYLMDQIDPKHRWGKRLLTLIESCPQPKASMGFPERWERCAIWQR